MKLSPLFKYILIFTTILLNVGCDQISKEIVRKKISDSETIHVIKENFLLMKVENDGAAMSLGSDLSPMNKIIFLQALPIIMLLFLLRMIIVNKTYSLATVFGLCCIIGGGMANIYDRMLYGSVTDFMFIQLKFFRTGVFNMADVSVMFGIFLVTITALFPARKIEQGNIEA